MSHLTLVVQFLIDDRYDNYRGAMLEYTEHTFVILTNAALMSHKLWLINDDSSVEILMEPFPGG